MKYLILIIPNCLEKSENKKEDPLPWWHFVWFDSSEEKETRRDVPFQKQNQQKSLQAHSRFTESIEICHIPRNSNVIFPDTN